MINKIQLTRLASIAAVIVVTLIALSARLTAVDKLPIDYDEDDYLRAGQIYATGIQNGDWSVFTRENYRTEHPPLTKIINGLVMAPLPPAPEIPDRPTTADPSRSLPQPHLDNVTLAMAISGLQREVGISSNLAAVAIMMSIPVVIVFIVLQRYLLRGSLFGAVEE